MKRVTATSVVLGFTLLTSPITAQAPQNNPAQDPRAVAEWNRNHDMGVKYKTALDLYMAAFCLHSVERGACYGICQK